MLKRNRKKVKKESLTDEDASKGKHHKKKGSEAEKVLKREVSSDVETRLRNTKKESNEKLDGTEKNEGTVHKIRSSDKIKKSKKEYTSTSESDTPTARRPRNMSFTSSTLRKALKGMEDETVTKFLDILLQQYEREGLLKELIMTMLLEEETLGGPSSFC